MNAHGQDFVVAGTGTDTVYAASAVVACGGAAGSLVVESGSEASTVVGGGGAATVYGSAGAGADQVAGGTGNDVFVAGTGQATMRGGGGANLFSFVAGSAGGADVITDFRSGVDHLALQGYAAGAVQAALSGAARSGGATVLSLGDGTRVTLLGVGTLHAGDFV